jgi:group II intron reverse transcriptase/maturase
MLKLDFFVNAYGKLYSNRGALTEGVDGETVDGTSIEKLEALIEELRTRQFKWTPARRAYIPKKKGSKKRPLGIMRWKDKVVQEVMRCILEAYYEPQFSLLSHAYRPKKGCHTALAEVHRWKGTKWFIEIDITGCFDNINHEVMVQIVGRSIQDRSFLNLLSSMLKAGYMENWVYHKTYSGTPQGAIVSPILSNIYLHELDEMVERELIP